jgi:hypothetical protein
MFYFILIQQLGVVTRIVSDIVNCPVLIVSLRELIMCGMKTGMGNQCRDYGTRTGGKAHFP